MAMDKASWGRLMYIKFIQGFVAGKGGTWEDRRTGKKKKGKKDRTQTKAKWEARRRNRFV